MVLDHMREITEERVKELRQNLEDSEDMGQLNRELGEWLNTKFGMEGDPSRFDGTQEDQLIDSVISEYGSILSSKREQAPPEMFDRLVHYELLTTIALYLFTGTL